MSHEQTQTDGGTVTYLSCAETAKMVRGAVKAAFPDVKFSVRSHTYAGGASINVYWTDGPLASEVDKIVKAFEGASFDGMIDLKSYHSSLVTMPGHDLPVHVHFGADYVFTNREHSPELVAQATEYAKAKQVSDGPATVYWTEDPKAQGIVGIGGYCSRVMWGLEQAAHAVVQHMKVDGTVVAR